MTEKQWRAVAYELAHRKASNSRIAKAAGVTPQVVHRWRQHPDYARGMSWLQAERYTGALERRNAAKPAAAPWPPRSKRDGDANLEVFLERNWPGSIRSPLELDGMPYTDAKQYLKHLVSHGVTWVGDLLDNEGKPIKGRGPK